MDILFKNAQIIDGLGQSLAKGWVLVKDDQIAALGGDEVPLPACPPETQEIDLTGKTLLPGLIDAHVHLTMDGGPDTVKQTAEPVTIHGLKGARHLGQSLAAGITTVRDLGAKDYINLHLRDAQQSGLITGSRVLACGHVICMTGGHAWFIGLESDGPDEVRKSARQELKAGADCLKFISTGGVLTPGVNPSFAQLSEEELAAGILEAHKVGLKTATHAQGAPGILNAVRAGIDSVEHGYYLTDEIIDLMLAQGTYLVLTITSLTNIVDNGVSGGIPDWAVEKAKTVIEAARQSHARAREAGVKIAMGTDAGTPYNLHGSNTEELAAMVDWGFSPMEAIVAATSNAAELLGISERLGRIAPGKTADLVVVNGDPLADVSTLSRPGGIEAVYQGGQLISS